ncbi:hypothetical protein [Streptomyces odontomachi]|uniref:hypothetical protein n=1 Tax=Streptomyces odontomachi TaxID=2944940 RepID=UPI00210AAC92|nr:hypothetical protein [Streptomyces sp. ODS25]
MPPILEPRPLSATELNERIRGLLLCSGGRLSDEQRAEYQALLRDWAAATREDLVVAA